MTTKTFEIDVFASKWGANGENGLVSRLLDDLVAEDACPTVELGGVNHEIRDLRRLPGGHAFRGIFAKFRSDDLPHAGVPGGPERELDLDEQEGLIEKNYFLYLREHELLFYQQNRNGSVPSRLGKYLSRVAHDTILFDPVLQPHAMRRLMRGEVEIRTLDLSFARPTNPELFPADDWGHRLFEVLSGAGGTSMRLHIGTDARSKDPRDHHLRKRLKRGVREILNLTKVTTARLEVEEDGVTHPIDLISDRLRSTQDVEMGGRYPVPGSMYEALGAARDELNDQLREIFGDADAALV